MIQTLSWHDETLTIEHPWPIFKNGNDYLNITCGNLFTLGIWNHHSQEWTLSPGSTELENILLPLLDIPVFSHS